MIMECYQSGYKPLNEENDLWKKVKATEARNTQVLRDYHVLRPVP